MVLNLLSWACSGFCSLPQRQAHRTLPVHSNLDAGLVQWLVAFIMRRKYGWYEVPSYKAEWSTIQRVIDMSANPCPMIDAYVSTKDTSARTASTIFLTAPMLFSHHRVKFRRWLSCQGPTQGLFHQGNAHMARSHQWDVLCVQVGRKWACHSYFLLPCQQGRSSVNLRDPRWQQSRKIGGVWVSESLLWQTLIWALCEKHLLC